MLSILCFLSIKKKIFLKQQASRRKEGRKGVWKGGMKVGGKGGRQAKKEKERKKERKSKKQYFLIQILNIFAKVMR